MIEGEFNIPFETGVQDRHGAKMLERFSIGKWMAGIDGLEKTLAEKPAFADLFAQMTKDMLIDAAFRLADNAEGMAIWGTDEAGKGSSECPGESALLAMRKNDLIAYIAAAYERAMPLLVFQLDYNSFAHFLWMTDQQNAALIGMVPEVAEESASGEDRVDLWGKYGTLIRDGLIIPKRLHQSSNLHFYGLFIPAQVRTFVREHNSELLIKHMLLDILDCYARAAANLYGVVTIEELLKIIGRYEAQITKNSTPHSEVAELDQLIASVKESGEQENLQGLSDRRKQISQMLRSQSVKDLTGHIHILTRRFDDFQMLKLVLDGKASMAVVGGDLADRAADDDELSQTIYDLLDERKGKPRYYPATYAVFMRYAQAMINEDVPATKHLAQLSVWLAHKHRNSIAKAIRQSMKEPAGGVFRQRYADTDDKNINSAANEIVTVLYRDIVCATLSQFRQATGFETLEKRYGLMMHNTAEANEYLALWNEINSKSRAFGNNGNTPLEITAKIPPHMGPAKLMFGPGMQGTELPQAIQAAIRPVQLGGQPAAGDGEANRAGRQVGRNELCPCGSGKKYKRCCGK